MSYQVLARKWRPSNFTEVAGQAHVLKSLINALDNQRLHHAYLFTGTRGVGKTTLARILAKCLNCEEGVSSKPCEKCDACTEISEGRFIDLIEVDAASRTKVEDTRELLENVQYTPARGRYKVYLIDEVHMLSNHSFNALLKTLEEPPPHVKFLFATTDPQKLPITILSRCLQFNLKNLSPKMISDYLAAVLQEERIKFDEEALWQIASSAGGSMRDALTLVDQAISFCEGSVSAAGVVEMLGVPEQQQVFKLLSTMAGGSVQSVLELVGLIAEQTPDYAHTLDSLLSLLHRAAIAQVMPEAIDNSFGDKEKVIAIASEISAEDIQLYYQIGSKGREELRYSAEVRATFEMLLLRMMVFSPSFVEQENTQSDASQNIEEGTIGSGISDTDGELEKKKIGPASKELSKIVRPECADQIEPKKQEVGGQLVGHDGSDMPLASVTSESHQLSSVSHTPEDKEYPELTLARQQGDSLTSSTAALRAPQQPKREPLSEPSGNITLANLNHELWLSSFSLVPASGIVANVLANTQLLSVNGSVIELRLDENQSAVFGDELRAKIETVFSEWLEHKVVVEVEVGKVEVETPARLNQRLREEEHAQMVSGFEQDSTVQELLVRFSGKIVENSISSREAGNNSKG